MSMAGGTLSWRRWMFRAGIVFAVLWIASMAAYFWADRQSDLGRAADSVVRPCLAAGCIAFGLGGWERNRMLAAFCLVVGVGNLLFVVIAP